MAVDIAVLGAGVIGLSTAINVQRAIPNARVTIIADKFYEETTSYGSGGMFIPSRMASPNVPLKDHRVWCRESWDHYSRLALSPDAVNAGMIIMSGYHLFDEHMQPQDPLYKEFVYSCREMTREEMKNLGVQNFRTGYKATTIIVYMTKYLVWLRKRFEEGGGKVIKRHINNIMELSGQYKIVMNCCGAGSGPLFGDARTQPVRGHIIRVRAPWIKHWFLTQKDTYVIPGEDLVGLGGVYQRGNTSLKVDPDDSKGIIDRCLKLCPNLKGAEIDNEWIGFRPGRENGVRLESEVFKDGARSIQVVHNYGHGSQGIGLSWGTAVVAANMASDILSRNISSKL